MKLTPVQISFLANIIQIAITNHPLDKTSSLEKHPVEMEDWEYVVKRAINNHPDMPNYEELLEKHMGIYEWLVEYYTAD